MAKIPFDITKRPQIERGEYKVETFSGYPVTIYRWDFDDGAQTPIMGSYVFEDGKEYVGAWNEEGHFDLMSPNNLDLFLVTPEPELSEFEKAVGLEIFDEPFDERHIKVIKEESAKLLALARKELEPEVLERLEAAYKNQDEVVYENGKRDGKAEALKEIEQDPESSYAFKRGVEYGKEEALKDLPRWRKVKGARGLNYSQETKFSINGRYLEMNDTLNDIYEISFEELEKLSRL